MPSKMYYFSLCLALSAFSCSDDKDDGDCGEEPCPIEKIQATADLKGAFGLLAIDQDGGLNLMEAHNETAKRLGLTAPLFKKSTDGAFSLAEAKLANEENSEQRDHYLLEGESFSFPSNRTLNLAGEATQAVMQKIDSETGEIKDALVQEESESENAFDPNRKLPKLLTIAVSPTKDVYLHFENSFIYKEADPSEDPWNQSNGFQCQIFKVDGGTLDDLLTQDPSHDNLACIDNYHFIDSWRNFYNGVFQFDSDGNVYYPGSIPNTQKMVVYKKARDGSDTTEVINANICVENFLITEAGGVFYTGQTCQTDGQNNGPQGGFFRYIAPGNGGEIVEIARDWWNFIFDTSVSEESNDTAVFFGPDPRSSSTASWDSACLFQFDPSGTDPSARVGEVITCGNNIWDWMQLQRSVDVTDFGQGYHNYTGTETNYSPSLEWRKEYKRRCVSKDEVFAGGGSQISSIEQDSAGNTYVIGNIRKKIEGTLRCSVELRGPHCVIDGIPELSDSVGTTYSASTCASVSGTWVNQGRCSDGSTDASCIEHSRSWTAGFCSNPEYTTKASCEAATGCSDNWSQTSGSCSSPYTWGSFVWQVGRCSSDDKVNRTESACTTAGHTWNTEEWAGSCTSTDSEDNAQIHNNNRFSCIPEWQTESVRYENVSNSLCTKTETGERDHWHDWDNAANNFAETASANRSVSADLSGKFIVQNLNCSQADGSTGNWTTEYAALAKVNSEEKTLELLSLESEKAINLWIVEDKPYYSSFDTVLGSYLLNGLSETDACVDTAKSESSCDSDTLSWTERKCLDSSHTTKTSCEDAGLLWQNVHPFEIISNFETYNLVESGTEGELFADGLDFNNNSYKFGTVNITDKTLLLKEGLTGTVKTIVILPKD